MQCSALQPCRCPPYDVTVTCHCHYVAGSHVISFMIYDVIARSARRPRQPRTVPIPVPAVDRQSDDERLHCYRARGICWARVSAGSDWDWNWARFNVPPNTLYLQTSIIAQMLSIGGEGKSDWDVHSSLWLIKRGGFRRCCASTTKSKQNDRLRLSSNSSRF